MSSLVVTLQALGIKPFQLQAWMASELVAPPCRVRAIDRGVCRLITAKEQRDGSLIDSFTTYEHPSWPAGSTMIDASLPLDLPLAVGDWAFVQLWPEDRPRVVDVVQRASCVRRAAAGGNAGDQLLVSNVDTVLIVSAFGPTAKLLRRGLNPRRIERYVAAVQQGGAVPVVVLNKVDLAEESKATVAELASRLAGIPVVALSAHDSGSLERLAPYLGPGQSVALLGMSGVGKSTLVNALLGHEQQATGGVRAMDTKGKHMTTRREMVRLADGTLLIDTPGMRELAVIADDDATAGFDDVAGLARACRFTDCSHGSEPGCAVQAAISQGRLSGERLRNYMTVGREALRLQARHDAYARHLQHKEYRRFARVTRDASKRREG